MILAVPDFRQSHDYDCGAASTRSVAAYFQVGEGSEADYIEALGTDRSGTCASRIVQLLRSFGLTVSASGMTLDELRRCIGPVICPIQDEGWGHYVVVMGIDGTVIHLQDPGAGRVMMPIAEFDRDWHDDGTTRLGIAVQS